MGTGIIEFISNIVNITGNPLLDTIIFGIIGVISFSIAFDLVGFIFGSIGKYDSKSMSDVHWGIRVFIFATLTFILVKIAQFIRWLLTPPMLYYFLGGIALFIIALIMLIVFKKSRKQEAIVNKILTQPVEKAPVPLEKIGQEANEIKLDICPFCGGKLVERKGPYGRFLGCINYPKCKYTRNKE